MMSNYGRTLELATASVLTRVLIHIVRHSFAPDADMALDPRAEAALALHRFGFGPRAGSIAAIASDPRGALKGGRVIADWPGLQEAQLQDGRDLKSTTDLRAVLKGVLKDHLRVDDAALADRVFPDSAGAPPTADLMAVT